MPVPGRAGRRLTGSSRARLELPTMARGRAFGAGAGAVAGCSRRSASELAWATGYLDHPEARKLHTSATALLGGAVVFVSALVALARRCTAGRAPRRSGARGLVLLAGALIALGARPVGRPLRHGPAAQARWARPRPPACCSPRAALPTSGCRAARAALLALVALVALMNAVNFLDNMNGMVGRARRDHAGRLRAGPRPRAAPTGSPPAQLALAGACVGFLPYNFPRARIFLGDAGSLLLGV